MPAASERFSANSVDCAQTVCALTYRISQMGTSTMGGYCAFCALALQQYQWKVVGYMPDKSDEDQAARLVVDQAEVVAVAVAKAEVIVEHAILAATMAISASNEAATTELRTSASEMLQVARSAAAEVLRVAKKEAELTLQLAKDAAAALLAEDRLKNAANRAK